jgi:hypothetical protein
VRLDAFFGSPNTSPPPSRIRCSWRLTRRVFPSKSMSDQRSPKASPILKPTVRERTYNASYLSPLAAARNVRACSASSGMISSCRTFGGSTLAAGLNGIRLNLTACSSARCRTAWMYRTLEGFKPSRSFAA